MERVCLLFLFIFLRFSFMRDACYCIDIPMPPAVDPIPPAVDPMPPVVDPISADVDPISADVDRVGLFCFLLFLFVLCDSDLERD